MKKSREHFPGRDERAELEVARTETSFVFDAKGKRYIDFRIGWCVGNSGWGNSVLVKEAKIYRGPDYIIPVTRAARARSNLPDFFSGSTQLSVTVSLLPR